MGKHRLRIERMVSYATLVKVSTEDLNFLYDDEQPETIIRRWQTFGPSLITVTDGENGAYALFKSEWIHWSGKNIVAVDTVGAGDSFQAALLSYFYQKGILSFEGLLNLTRQQLDQAVLGAIFASSLTCTRQGADLPYRHELF